MKVLIVGSPRTGSTYLLHIMARFFMKEICADMPNMNHDNFISIMDKFLDEPFSDHLSLIDMKQRFDGIMKLPAWVVKIHATHITPSTNKWVTRLYKDADIIIKLTRRDIRGTALSHCIAMTRHSYNDNHGVVHAEPLTIHDSIVCAYSDQVTIEGVPYDIEIDYADFKDTAPEETFYRITGLRRTVNWNTHKLPHKNTARLDNMDEFDKMFDRWMQTADKLRSYNEQNYQ